MNGIERIAAERRRQIEQEGYDAHHDDNAHASPGELLLAAEAYIHAAYFEGSDAAAVSDPPSDWPWEREAYKLGVSPGDVIEKHHAIRMLEKAGALIAAEIDRLERAAHKEASR